MQQILIEIMKKIGKAIARKFKNWKTTTSKETVVQEPSISSSTDKRRRQKILEDISSVKTTIEQQTTPIAKTTTAKDENSKEICKYSVTNKDTTRVIDKATEADTQLCNEKGEIETTNI